MLTSTSLFLFFTSSLFSSFPVYGEGDIVKVKDKNDTKPSFHRLMPLFNFFKVELRDMEKKELSLVGKDNVVEKVIVKKDKSLFGKDFKVVFSFVRSSSVCLPWGINTNPAQNAHFFAFLAVMPIYKFFVTRVNQDHSHSVIQSSIQGNSTNCSGVLQTTFRKMKIYC